MTSELAHVSKSWFYIVSFISFWVAVSLKDQIFKFVAEYPVPTLLTVVIMWALAMVVFPLILAYITLQFLYR